MMQNRLLLLFLVVVFVGMGATPGRLSAEEGEERHDPLAMDNLVAWCIVPFDAAKRGPAERAQMLVDLGIHRCAYDWRDEHVASFEQEILEYQKRGIEFFAFWSVHEEAFRLFEKYKIHPQIWQTLADPGGDSAAKVQTAAERLLPLAERTKQLGCKLGLYNHGGWGGVPENMVAVCKRLREAGHDHVGIVYNFHHGHDEIDRFAHVIELMKPYLHCLNLNGMNRGAQPKILGIGKGEHELAMIRSVIESGYQGPIGIVDHREQLDAKESLQENLDGLAKIRELLKESPPSPAQPDLSQAEREQVDALVARAMREGDARRGARVFADARFACISCHRVGAHGGALGPELTRVRATQNESQIVASLLWPRRDVRPEYVVWQVLTADGRVQHGYRIESDDRHVVLRDQATGNAVEISRDEIEEEIAGSTPMPEGLLAAASPGQQADLVRFLLSLDGSSSELPGEIEAVLEQSQQHGPDKFAMAREPVDPARWPNASHHVNRERVYDFYTKQSEHYRMQAVAPRLLAAYPGLDGEHTGHWGNQTEADWADDRWRETDLGVLQAGVFRAQGVTVPRGVCVRLGDQGELAVCFNPDTLTYDAMWRGGFVQFSSVRHGFLGGLAPAGELLQASQGKKPDEPFSYRGFYRDGNRVVFCYRLGDVEYLDAPWVKEGEFTREVAPVAEHSMRDVVGGGEANWPESMETAITPGTGAPYAVDTIELPKENRWKSLMYIGDHDFLADGSAMIGTMQGDVWHVSGLDAPLDQPAKARWRRYAAGLHHALGLVVVGDDVYVQCRDQITRLVDRNRDGEADFYECFSNAFITSPAGHDFICGLARDAAGSFYTASGNQGLVRISADGQTAEVIATGFRNPDGVTLLGDGSLAVPCSEGEWTPASMICRIEPSRGIASDQQTPPHFGYRGPQGNQVPELPLAYLPRGLDNASGGQVLVTSSKWGPFQGQIAHLSFGAANWSIVLQDRVDGQTQGAVIPMTGDFASGVHRGRFHPLDGQLYVSGMKGWGTYAVEDGCFQRIRYTGAKMQSPIAFHVHENGVRVQFAEPIEKETAGDPRSHFAQSWNYRYAAGYGSPEISATHPGTVGHDVLDIASVHCLEDGHSLFIEIPELQPCNQLHLRMHVNSGAGFVSSNPVGEGHDMFVTVHAMDRAFQELPGYVPREKTIATHPLLTDLAIREKRQANPWQNRLAGMRGITIEAGKNLTFSDRQIHARVNEPLELTFINPDVVPHNWVLIRPGTLETVGELSNRLIADPDAFARHYIPESDDVLVYTDIVSPGERQTIFFQAPAETGRYPFLCTFPGHWMVMNGELVVGLEAK